MIAIKTTMEYMPSDCDFCRWFGTRPHPYKGWTDICELMGHCMDDDQPEEWIYSGEGRPKACPLVEVTDRKTENSSEIPNNCEHITENGVTCAKYPACDDCLNNPLNKVKGSERLVKGSEKPNNKEINNENNTVDK